ncbi:DEAD/DEAH box helicase [Bacteroides sp. UBA939]|uniref:DEAD/DEAH box helicase n=1 Tax=Bacteroides sp. UBA939 TaxID=1946092 RepID=UPI0025BCE1CF|nr:AAA domain-containing protein [Bacteroides sp. UBA939]
MEAEVQEYYNFLIAVCRDGNIPLTVAYRQLRELLERICRTQMPDGNLQMTDLSARISFVASKAGLTIVEQNRLHTFRLTSNAVLNRQSNPSRENLLRDAKTLSFFIKRLTGEDIPTELYRLLPRADATYIVAPPAKERVRRMRVCFQYADDTYLYVLPTDTLADEPLRVRYNIPQVNEEFTTTCKLLWRHAQVNLLDVAIDEAGILTPAFIILEPDYLIDISSLAECFKEYGHHPANYLLARLQSPDNTRPLLLGNIANLFLDEWIYSQEEPGYLDCMKKAFRTYAIELAACTDLLDKEKEHEFFADCKRHFEHIRQTVTETFRTPGYELDKTDAVLEPTYICEALGLQGRLDYMQRDMSSFIEMKSGKADEYTIRGKVEPKENNKVQMLLYQAVLEYSMGMDHRKVKAYLLYTRYPLLYPARPSWAMVRRVMDVRNRIVANEYGIQLRNSPYYTAERLREINPDTLNERGLNNILWKRFLYPSIDAVAQRIKALTPLEQCYFHTLYNFITKELYTSKSGDIDYEGRTGAAALWLSTLAEKCEAGEILHDLTIRENHAADARKAYLVLARRGDCSSKYDCSSKHDCSSGHNSSSQCDCSSRYIHSSEHDNTCQCEPEPLQTLPNFREGDAIVLYERNNDTDNVTNKMVFKGNIEQITDTDIRIRLRASQQNTSVLPSGSRYAVEHDFMDTSFRSMYLGLSAFLSANKERRDLLLFQREAEFDTSLDADIASAPDDFSRITLKAQAAKDYFLLVGPPGTGKTSRALRSMVEVFHREGKQILLLSYTNRAVDEICKALSAINPEVDFIRIGNELSCDSSFRAHLIENVLEACSTRREVHARIERCRIFVGTVATLSTKTELFRLKSFDVAIVDEATQILEPQLLGLLCARNIAGGNAIGKFILIGDHKQLPAVVLQSENQSEVGEECLHDAGLHNLKDSLFERLYRKAVTSRSSSLTHHSPSVADRLSFLTNRFCDMLCRQGRMNVEVAHFPNKAFYGGLLESVGLPHQHGHLALAPELLGSEFADILDKRVAFLPSVPESVAQSAKVNHSEAKLVARLAQAVYQQYSANVSGIDSNPGLGSNISPGISSDTNSDLNSVPGSGFNPCTPHLPLHRTDPGTDTGSGFNPRTPHLPLHRTDSGTDTSSGFNSALTLGVITPYRSQIALIKREIAALGIPALENILVDTVERFQGSERDVIIYSFCVNRTYQLKFLANMTEENGIRIDRKLNVALTRARKQLFVIGVPRLLRLNPIYSALLDNIP